MASERAEPTTLGPAAACSRAEATELPGIHSVGLLPSASGQVPSSPSTTASESAGVTSTDTHLSPTGPADSLNFLANAEMLSAIAGSARTATFASPPRQRSAAASERLDSASPKNRHTMTPATSTTTPTSAAITLRLTPRRPGATTRWLPVHSPALR